tara:strand:+ start:376 stop:546 length:171 start_codon:yes stop_codon:yes gene_type:complete
VNLKKDAVLGADGTACHRGVCLTLSTLTIVCAGDRGSGQSALAKKSQKKVKVTACK